MRGCTAPTKVLSKPHKVSIGVLYKEFSLSFLVGARHRIPSVLHCAEWPYTK